MEYLCPKMIVVNTDRTRDLTINTPQNNWLAVDPSLPKIPWKLQYL